MNEPEAILSVDPETGDTCVLLIDDGFAREVSSDDMRKDLMGMDVTASSNLAEPSGSSGVSHSDGTDWAGKGGGPGGMRPVD